MQSRAELVKIITNDRPDLGLDIVTKWCDYLLQLNGCRLASARSQELDPDGWLEARVDGIGGSEIASIMGKNPWSSARQVWLSKTKQLTDQTYKQSEAARWGNVLEQTIAQEWALRNDRKYINLPVQLQSEEHSYMLANVDGFLLSDDLSAITGILEIKTTTEYNKSVWEYGPLPEYYICQANWYSKITGLDNYTMVCLVGGQTLFDYELIIDESLCAEMIDAADIFWNKNVKELIEPHASAGDIDVLKNAVQVDAEMPAVILEDDESERLVDSYVQIRDKISALEKVKKAIYAQVFDIMGSAHEALTKTRTIRVQQSARRSCNLDVLQENYPDAYEQCVTVNISKSLRIK